MPAARQAGRPHTGRAFRRLSDTRAASLLCSVDAGDGVVAERKHQAADLLADVRRLDHELAAIQAPTSIAVQAAHTSLIELHGVGPVVAPW